MAGNGDNHIFRFLDLPGELRARIYDFYFEDRCPKQVHITELQNLLPKTELVRASRQIYRETIKLLKALRSAFWYRHPLVINIDKHVPKHTRIVRNAIVMRAAEALKGYPIRTIVVRVARNRDSTSMHIIAIALTRRHQLEFTAESLASDGTRTKNDKHAVAWKRAVEGRVIGEYFRKGRLWSEARKGCLNVLAICNAIDINLPM